ncbi:MAG TPA: ABC transporter ATP-binding protein [Allocoleopsis sp.]
MLKDIQTIKQLVPLFRMYPWSIPVLVLLGILSSLSEGLGISLLIPFLQGTIQHSTDSSPSSSFTAIFDRIFSIFPAEQQLLIIPLCIFLSILLKNFLLYTNQSLFIRINAQINHQLRAQTFQQLMQVSFKYLDQQNSGKLLNLIAKETWQTARALETLVNLMICFCTILVFATFLFLISWQFTCMVGIAALLISYLVQLVVRRVDRLSPVAVQANAVLTDRMYEGLAGMRTIRAFCREDNEQQRFDHASDRVRSIFSDLEILGAAVGPLYETLSAFLVISVLIIALHTHRATVPSLLVFLFMLYRLQPQVQILSNYRVTLRSLDSSVREIVSFLDCRDKPYPTLGHLPFRGLKQAIEFKTVGFQYNPGDRWALQNVSLTIPQGKVTALVGTSGAGKSTLVNLICRFYEPSIGKLYVDGLPLNHLNLVDWRSHIAIVNQEVHIFSSTIRDNIAYGAPHATEAEILAAAQQANAHEFISQLPKGYDTPVGDRGFRLSGGQRQRIALARAMLCNPDILILDEATNALDTISEHLIQEALDRFGRDRTVIVIAHRLSTIERADQIFVLDQGQVVEQGSLTALLHHNGLFAQLYRLQYHHAISQD